MQNKKTTLADLIEKDIGAKEYDSTVELIQRWYYGSLVKAPWCATCVSYYATICGNAVRQQIGKHENVDMMKEYMAARKRLHKTCAYGGYWTPKRGDVIFFSSKHTYDDCTHVAIVSGYQDGLITYTGGNQNDMICQKMVEIDDKYAVAIGEVIYV